MQKEVAGREMMKGKEARTSQDETPKLFSQTSFDDFCFPGA